MEVSVKFVEPAEPLVHITLTLTKRQAAALAQLACEVGGEPQTTIRKLFDSMWAQIKALGIQPAGECIKRQNGTLYFYP